VDVQAMHVDLLAFPGHKGLLGPLGTGGLYLRPGMERLVRPVRAGGTGSRSEQDVQPDVMPDRYEAGSQNAIGLAGLAAAVGWFLERRDELWSHERELKRGVMVGLAALDALGSRPGRLGLRLLGPKTAEDRVGVFSLTHESLSPHELAGILEQEYGILARAGLHCAPRAHGAMGTRDRGGALRLSVGPFTTVDDVRLACRALGEICQIGSAPESSGAPAQPAA
jgi:selenocysteine lyase/cysteine desulfurase